MKSTATIGRFLAILCTCILFGCELFGGGRGDTDNDGSDADIVVERTYTVELSYVDTAMPYGWSSRGNYPCTFLSTPPDDLVVPVPGDQVYYGELIFLDTVRYLFAISISSGSTPQAHFYLDANRNYDMSDDGDAYPGSGTYGTGTTMQFAIPRPDGKTEPYQIWLWTSIRLDEETSTPQFNYYAWCHKAGILELATNEGTFSMPVALYDQLFDAAYTTERIVVDWNSNQTAEDADEVTIGESFFFKGVLLVLEEITQYAERLIFSTEPAASAPPDALDVEADLALEVTVGEAPPPIDVNDIDGSFVSLNDYLGRVVLIDFWATWCGPCLSELPNVRTTYETYHSQGFEIIGISLDTSITTLRTFMASNGVTWRQICDELGWQGELVARYRVEGIPMPILIGRDGKVISTNARGSMLATLVAGAL